MSGFEWSAVLVLSALVVLRIVVVLGLALAVIRPVRGCPACFQPTVPLRPPWALFLPRLFEWRWCPACRWEGPARRLHGTPGTTPRPPGRTGTSPTERPGSPPPALPRG